MKGLQEHLYSERGADGNIQEEKRRIYEQFRFSSVRARKFASENNRRRRALEERQKRWDIEEEQMRQKIIQQRKQRIKNATQRFQRSHLPPPPPPPPPHPHPPPQRCMQFQRINVPTVEEALNEIQSRLDSCNFQASTSTSKSRSRTSSPNPIKPLQSSHREALTAAEAISQVLPVQSKTGIINHQKTEEQPRKQQDYPPQVYGLVQNSHSSDNCDSESLSSKDSLENADSKCTTENARSSSYLSPPVDSQRPRARPASFTEIIVLGDNLSNSGKHNIYQQKKQEALEEFNINKIQAANNNTSNAFQEERLKQTGWKIHHQKPSTESTVTINNFSKILNTKCKPEKPNVKTSLKQTSLNNSESDALKYPRQPAGGGQKLRFSAATPHPGKRVTFNKGDLKNQSEKGSLHSPVENNFGHFTFSKNLASMIRDSIELTKVKNKELWGNDKVMQKKCWFDEEQTRASDPNLTPSNGHHFAKQAWTDVGVQVRLHEERAPKVIVPLNGLGGKSPQRTGGTVYVQPQTAAEVNQLARTQGKNVISHAASRRMTSEEKAMDLECTPTDEQISQIWHSVRSALTTPHAKTTITTNASDSGQVKRKPHLEQNRLHPDPGNRRFQRTPQMTEPVRLTPSTCDGIFPVKGLIVPKLHRSQAYADPLEDRAMGRGQKHRPGVMHKPTSVLRGLGTISMEEHRVLLSLERLDQLLQRVRKRTGQHVQNCSPSAQDIKYTMPHIN